MPMERHRHSGHSRFLILLTVTTLALARLSLPAFADPIPWRTGAVSIERQTPEQIEAALRTVTPKRATDARHVLVQFDRPADGALRAQVAADGLQVLSYVGPNTFFAALAPQALDAANLSRAGLVGVEEIRPAWKLHPMLNAGQPPAWSKVGAESDGTPIVGVYLVFHRDVDLTGAGVALAESYGANVRSVLESVQALVIELPADVIPILAEEDAVQWIEPPLPKLDMVNDSNRVITQANDVQATPYNLDGSGVTVMVYDGGTARSTHVDFEGRLTVHDSSGMNYHSTHVAGTIGGAGVANSAYKGMAPGVTMVSYGYEYDGSGVFLYDNAGDIEDDYDEAINTYGADLSNNSIGTNTALYWDCAITGDYGVTSELIDTIVRGDGSNPKFDTPYRVVWANGNERQTTRCGDTYNTTAPPAGAKNHITVGALNSNDDSMTSFSSWGAGRRRPAEARHLRPRLPEQRRRRRDIDR